MRIWSGDKWHVYDKQSGKVMHRTKSEDAARAKADKLNRKEGCYRFSFRRVD